MKSKINSDIRVIQYDDLPLGGFAGITEKRMLMNPFVWGPEAKNRTDISHGLDDFIYLAMAEFRPHDGVPMHPHRNIDIVSFVFNGEIEHAGTLGNGTIIKSPGVQVQRSGTGMQHSEFSITDDKTNMLQLWFLPPSTDLKPEYKDYKIESEANTNDKGLTTVLGGSSSTNAFHSKMTCKVGYIEKGATLELSDEFVVIIFEGTGKILNPNITKDIKKVSIGSLIEGRDLQLQSVSRLGVITIQKNI